MTPERIVSIETRDARFPVESGASTNAVYSDSEYAFATTLLATASGMFGMGKILVRLIMMITAIKMDSRSPLSRQFPVRTHGSQSASTK